MNDITYRPGGSLDNLEEASLSAPYQGWEQTFRLNVLAPYYLTAGLVRLLGTAAARGDGRGCVIMLSSPASVHNHQFVPCYQTSKAAVDHLVRIMAAEFADYYSMLLLLVAPFIASLLQHLSDFICSSRQWNFTRHCAFRNDNDRCQFKPPFSGGSTSWPSRERRRHGRDHAVVNQQGRRFYGRQGYQS